MSEPSELAKKTASGAMWTIAAGLGARVLGLVGSLLLTRYLAPEVYGAVNVAYVVVLTAYFATSLGLGQYVVVTPGADRRTIFTATALYVGLGPIVLGIVYALRAPIAGFLNSPGMVQYLPGLMLAVFLDRLWYIPDRLMIRDMRFRETAIRNTVGEVAYTFGSVLLAIRGWGGNAIVVATLLRAILRTLMTVTAVPRAEWLTPSRPSREKIREMLRFGVPLNLASLANFGSQRWDNLVMSKLFGEAACGLYNIAWNVADIPASQVGERVGDVLVPSFAKLEPERRRAALLRSLTLLSLLIFPLAVGLGAVATTLLTDTIFNEKWAAAGPYLMVLSALGVTRPIGWVISSYLQVYRRTRSIMALEWLKAAAIVGGVYALGSAGGQLWACAGVGAAFGAHALASMWLVRRLDGISYLALIRPLLSPLVACAPMVAAVLAVRYGLARFEHLPRGVRITSEVTVGAIAFVLSALVFARSASRDFLKVVKDVIRRRRG